jgi:hypothetical protein
LAIVNNAGVILNSYEWYRGAYHDLLEILGSGRAVKAAFGNGANGTACSPIKGYKKLRFQG